MRLKAPRNNDLRSTSGCESEATSLWAASDDWAAEACERSTSGAVGALGKALKKRRRVPNDTYQD